MRILLVTGSLPPMKCGVGDYTARLAQALGRCEQLRVAVLTDVAASPVPPDQGYEVFPVARGWRAGDLWRILRLIRHWRPDLIHVQYPSRGYGRALLPWILPPLHALTGIPVVQTWHQYHTGLKGSLRNLLNAAIGGGLVVVEPDYQQQLPPWFRHLIRRKRFRYIPNSSNIPFVELSESERGSIRARIAPGADRVVTFFGFAYPSKGIELLFEVADPSKHYLVLVCDLDASDPYHRQILALTQGAWQGKVTITGFLPPEEVARVLAASDAAVLPFREGAGMRNASIHATTLQGTVVVTTSREGQGYVEAENIFYCKPGDIAAMRQALDLHMGRKSATVSMNRRRDWEHIAEAHLQLYREVTGRSSTPA